MSFVSDFFYPTLWGPKITVWISHTLSILPDSSCLPDRASLIAQLVKNPGLIPGLGRSPGEGIGYPLQYSGLENSMDWIVHGVTKSRTWLSNFHLSSLLEMHTWSVSNLEDCCKYSFSFNFFLKNFIWLCWVFVAVHGILSLYCAVQDLFPWPGIEPHPLHGNLES